MRGVLWLAVALVTVSPLAAQEARPTLDSAALDALRRVLRLPQATQDARRAGVGDSAIRVIIDDIRRRRLPAGDAQRVLEEETEAVKAGAPKDNFGAFVQAQLASGKRGRELAEAIRAEHAKRGHARGHGMQGAARETERGQPGAGRGRPEGARGGPPAADTAKGGKPDSVGQGKGRRQ